MNLINTGNRQHKRQTRIGQKYISSSSRGNYQVPNARRGKQHVSLDELDSRHDQPYLGHSTASRCNPVPVSNLSSTDSNIVYNSACINECGQWTNNDYTSSNYQEGPSQPHIPAQTFRRTPSPSISPQFQNVRYELNEPDRIPLAAVGEQFADCCNATKASHLSHYRQNFDHVPWSSRNASMPLSAQAYQPLGLSNSNAGAFCDYPTDMLGNGLGNSQPQSNQMLGRSRRLIFDASSRTLDGSQKQLCEDPRVGGSIHPGYDQRIEPRYPQGFYDNSAADLSSTTPYPSRHGLPSFPAKTLRVDAPPSQTSYGNSGLTSPHSFKRSDSGLPLPQYDPPPFAAFTASDNTHVSTRSSIDPINAQRSTLTPTSTELPSTLTSMHSSRHIGSSQGSLADPAICPHCNQVVSRAVKPGDRLSNLNRHIRDKHKRAEGSKPTCPERGCGKTFERSDYVIRHRRTSHGFRSSNTDISSSRS